MKIVYKDSRGRVIGSSETQKPDYYGRQTTTFKDKAGQTTGKAQTSKADYYGRKKTKVQGKTPLDGLR